MALLQRVCRAQKWEINIFSKSRVICSIFDLIVLHRKDGMMTFQGSARLMLFCRFCCADPAHSFESIDERHSLITGYHFPADRHSQRAVETDSQAFHRLRCNFRTHYASQKHRDSRTERCRSSSRALQIIENQFRVIIEISKDNGSDNQYPIKLARWCRQVDFGNKWHSRYYVPEKKRCLKNAV